MFAALTLIALNSFGQSEISSLFTAEGDSTYYDDLESMLTVRFFSANKYSDFTIADDSIGMDLDYRSNPTQVLGFGASYKGISLNAGYGFSFANQDDSIFGKTQRFDFQTQIQARKLTINIYSNIYSGYYLNNSYNVINNWPEGKYYTRKDIKGLTLGLSASYIFNYKRYSNRATFLQTEWQKKTAGSFVAGFSAIYNKIAADSSIIPEHISNSDFFGGADYQRSNYYTLGGHVGYIVTFVFFKKLFFNGGINSGTLLGTNSIFDEEENRHSKTSINFTLLTTLGVGYNSKYFYAGFSYSSFFSAAPTPIEHTTLSFSNGKYQLVMAYRFKVRKNFRLFPKSWPIDL